MGLEFLKTCIGGRNKTGEKGGRGGRGGEERQSADHDTSDIWEDRPETSR